MPVIVTFAFLRAGFADRGAAFQHEPENRQVLTGPSHCQTRRRRTNICAIEAGADALFHVHRFSLACVGARHAYLCTKHGMAGRSGQFFVAIVPGSGVQPEHSMDRHRSPVGALAAGFPTLLGSG